MMTMSEEKGESGTASLERDFTIHIDEIKIEFEGQTPRLTGRIEINLEVPVEGN